MVHNLRSRNICNTSPAPHNSHNSLLKLEGSSVNDSSTTPLNGLTPNVGAANKGNAFLHSTILHQTTVSRRPQPQYQPEFHLNLDVGEHLVHQDIEPACDLSSIQPLTGDTHTTSAHNSSNSYQQNLSAAIDEVIFNSTSTSRKGISLYAVKKCLNEDYGYKATRYRELVTKYISENLSAGKLLQISGKGANGTFRLNRSWHCQLTRVQNFHFIQKRSRAGKSSILNVFKRMYPHRKDVISSLIEHHTTTNTTINIFTKNLSSYKTKV